MFGYFYSLIQQISIAFLVLFCVCLFIWLHWVLVAACGIFLVVACELLVGACGI